MNGGDKMNDEEIIELYFKRLENAILETEKKYGKLCYNVAKNILNSIEDSKECINDTYLAMWNAIPPTKPKVLSAFICRITRNLAIKKCRIYVIQSKKLSKRISNRRRSRKIMNKNEIHKMISLINDDFIEQSEFKPTYRLKLKSIFNLYRLHISVLVASCIIFFIIAHAFVLIYVNHNKEFSSSSLVTFNKVRYDMVLGSPTPSQTAILEKYGLAYNHIQDMDMIGDFVGYVGGTIGSEKPKKDVFKLYYVANMKTLDILIMQSSTFDYSYVISENAK